MHVRNAAGGQDLIPQRVEHAEAVQEHQSHNNEDRARDVKEDMDHARALGVSLGADGANDGGRDAVADVDADDDGVNGRKCQRAGRGDGLQNADGSRGALQQEGDARAQQEAEHRLAGELIEHIGKALGLRQRADRCRHAEKSGKENAETHCDRADGIGLAALDRHQENNADDCGQRRQRRGLEEVQKRRLRRVHVEKTDDLSRHGRTDVRAQDDADGLVQRHDARTDEA